MGLDVIIVAVHGGEAFTIGWEAGVAPLFWRPKIKLVSRIYNLKTKKTIKTFKTSQSVTWREFFAKVFSFRRLFGWGALYDNQDMERLLYQGCLELVDKMHKGL
ncbi:MAG: hypothetical protein ABJH06_06040 [Paraglaciecola sp.]|uniref:hypothetical protein n=1 Tax=Paraglaciecola sp. TaxID=1920173 RepID=UPI0032998B89